MLPREIKTWGRGHALRPQVLATTTFALLLAILPAAPTAQAAPPPVPHYAYSLLAPAEQSPSQLIVRSIQAADQGCPTLTSGSASVPLTVRPAPVTRTKAFAEVSVCEIAVPAGSAPMGTVTFVDGVTAQVPTAISPAISKIAVIGDTGCRLVHNIQQDCDNARKWPLAIFARQIAEAAPQVVLHVGDYFYDSWPCEDKSDCSDVPLVTEHEPFQGSWASFRYSFIAPFAPVFPVAPILAQRGNQEACSTAGISYFYFLHPAFGSSRLCDPKGNRAPTPLVPAYAVDLTTEQGQVLRLVVTDSTYANDQEVDIWAKRMRPIFQSAEKLASATPAGGSAWLLTHRPVFGIRSTIQCGDVKCAPFSRDPKVSRWISADVQAASYGTLAPYDAILSGHVHLTQAVQVKGQPAQFIAGAGGTELSPTTGYERPKFGALANGLGKRMDAQYRPYPTVREWTTAVAFSYGMAEPTTDGWSIQAIGVRDKVIARCDLERRTVSCRR